ncbi:HNH endonuclease [Streptomyces sp. RPA4-5]|uniref:HNH endonuclease family protein n=1 Tax=Streptomyces platensis TaxID=58346 RepID=UPI00143E654F|nr:HNH endonuclease [Streptomyces sp. RPA4-5]
MSGEPGQGLSAEVGELVDRLLRLSKPFLEPGDLCLEPDDLRFAGVRDLSDLLQGLEASLELRRQERHRRPQARIDHVVPLAEAWDSGASKWTAGRRESYANDLGADRSLVAVSLGPNRTKGDKDPAEWMPPTKDATCTYATDWVTAKLRWRLTAGRAEINALRTVAAGCRKAKVTFTPAP